MESYVVQDEYVVKAMIDATIVMEKYLLKHGAAVLGKPIINKLPFDDGESGFEVEILMEEPKLNKPVIYTYNFRINTVLFHKWVSTHANMFGGEMLGFRHKITGLMIFLNKRIDQSFAVVDIIGSKTPDVKQLLKNGITLIVHREVVNVHAWIVKIQAKD